ncbi:MAG TPA: hypothetical protein VH518_06640 [Tepidisphaeraceae bacterium]|jgi:hypothetical protein
MSKKRLGRPEKAKSDLRTNVLRIRLTQAERVDLEKAAAGKTLDASTWARMVLLEKARG